MQQLPAKKIGFRDPVDVDSLIPTASDDPEAPQPWDQLPGEPDIWYERFEVYRLLGAGRSIDRAFRVVKQTDDNLSGSKPHGGWRTNQQKWRWLDRARAWDRYEHRRFLQDEKEQRELRRAERLEMIAEIQADAFRALQTAGVHLMTEEEARVALPQLRMLFVDMVKAERAEYGDDEQAGMGDGNGVVVLPEAVYQALARAYGEDATKGLVEVDAS